MVKRSAFTLMELVITIVVIGFILSAMPMLLIEDTKSREASIVQEGIYAATAKMSQIMSYKWDESSSENNGSVSVSKVLDVTGGDTELARNGISKFRVGHFQLTARRSLYTATTNSSALGNDANDAGTVDDIDDNHSTALITVDDESDGYKKTYTVAVSTDYISDAANYASTALNGFEFEAVSANPTNIKRIKIDILGEDQGVANITLFSLTAYSSNIGESEVISRIFQ